jgi:glycogen debranching enzyme
LRLLASLQGSELNDARDEQPGKIVHEIRHGEMARTGEVPFGRYYGSVDSTPLFLWLLGRYVAVTGDLKLAEELWPNVHLALEWLRVEDLQVGEGSSVSFLARRAPYTATVEILNRPGPVSVKVRN